MVRLQLLRSARHPRLAHHPYSYGFVLPFPAMKRRDLLKALPAIAVATRNGKPLASLFAIPADRKVIAFVNANVIAPDIFADIKFPVEVTICTISVPEGKTIDDVIRIYETEPH